MKEKIRLAWQHYLMPSSGLARGYLASAWALWAALRAHPEIELHDAGDEPAHPRVHLHYCPPHFFKPRPGKKNVLFTMWEGDVLPDEVRRQLARADVLVVPSQFCQALWRAHGVDAAIVPLGVAHEYQTAETERTQLVGPGVHRRFLWVGSNSQRKGWPLLMPAWNLAFPPVDGGLVGAELYIKTISHTSKKVVTRGSVTIDTRDVEPSEMLALYESAHVHLTTSLAEGFGLPTLEAMAAGCLAVAPLTGGLTHFVSDATALVIEKTGAATIEYGKKEFAIPVPSPTDIAQAIRTAFELWGSPALESRRRAGTEHARTFSWARSADTLVAAVFGRLREELPQAG
jgi:glycosyltransferase involved in cell wall biosynthesis